MVLCGDHLSLQAGCGCGWHALWEEQGAWEASTLAEYGVGEAIFPLLMSSSTSLGSILALNYHSHSWSSHHGFYFILHPALP